MLFGMLFQQFYNMMDTIIVGKYLGVQALAAVGSTGFHQFHDYWFLHGSVQRLCHSCSSEIWREKFPSASEICSQWGMAVSGILRQL